MGHQKNETMYLSNSQQVTKFASSSTPKSQRQKTPYIVQLNSTLYVPRVIDPYKNVYKASVLSLCNYTKISFVDLPMTLVPSTSSATVVQSRKFKSFCLRQVNVVHCTSYSRKASPFTEKHSVERYERESWLYKNQLDQPFSSCPPTDQQLIRDYDIASQLPELKKLLEVLSNKRRNENGVDKRGPGNVFLVGTGPGDPELLTLKALRAIESADLVLYDRLVSNDVLHLVGPNARLLYVGKTAGYHSRTQEEIHELLLSFAEAGATVVRLKGGDPLVFGRGGEEVEFLQQQGIAVKVIPGITAASGIAAELGIPLTHRGVANSVRFLTGHSRKGGTDPLYVAENAADPDSTLVVYMGLLTLPSLAAKLMHHGLPQDTPAAAIERGTTPQQRIVFAELQDLADEIQSHQLLSPTLIIIGKVVALSPSWPHSVKETSTLIESR